MTSRSLPEIEEDLQTGITQLLYIVKTIVRLSEQDDEMKKYKPDKKSFIRTVNNMQFVVKRMSYLNHSILFKESLKKNTFQFSLMFYYSLKTISFLL